MWLRVYTTQSRYDKIMMINALYFFSFIQFLEFFDRKKKKRKHRSRETVLETMRSATSYTQSVRSESAIWTDKPSPFASCVNLNNAQSRSVQSRFYERHDHSRGNEIARIPFPDGQTNVVCIAVYISNIYLLAVYIYIYIARTRGNVPLSWQETSRLIRTSRAADARASRVPNLPQTAGHRLNLPLLAACPPAVTAALRRSETLFPAAIEFKTGTRDTKATGIFVHITETIAVSIFFFFLTRGLYFISSLHTIMRVARWNLNFAE